MFTKTITPNGAKLLLCDDISPEDGAMLQALYSRSAESAEQHLEKVQRLGSGNFAQSYYVNFNHKSIGDGGSTTLFIEGVSMLTAKAIQDWPLYSGQETSTRYVDMTRQPMVDLVGTPESKAILDRWMNFYRDNMEAVVTHVAQQYPRRPEESEATYASAVKARAFDIMRGFLPAGLSTQLSWHTNLRQAGDHLAELVHHPLAEVRDVAQGLRKLLAERYPSSGGGLSLPGVSGVKASEGEVARKAWMAEVAQFRACPSTEPLAFMTTKCNREVMGNWELVLDSRPRGAVLPHFLSDLGQFTFTFDLDFGSFRDLQRHRNGVCRMPRLMPDYFHPWYTDHFIYIDGPLQKNAHQLIDEQTRAILKISDDPFVRQYYCAMGFEVRCQVTYSLPALLYVLELRSMRTVHPTLRRVVLRMAREFRKAFPFVALHVDESLDDWDVRRGGQTIVAK